jgi:hypothetical protein
MLAVEGIMEIIYIILAWLFGLLASPIVSRIERIYKRKDLQMAIFSELEYLAVLLTTSRYLIQAHLGITDRDSLNDMKRIYEKCGVDCPKEVLAKINKMLELNDEQLRQLLAHKKADQSTSIDLRTHSLPFIESILGDMSVFDSKFRRNILEIRSQVNMLNEITENGIFYHKLTFDSSSMSNNASIILKNLKEVYDHIQRRCKITTDRICSVLDERPNT